MKVIKQEVREVTHQIEISQSELEHLVKAMANVSFGYSLYVELKDLKDGVK